LNLKDKVLYDLEEAEVDPYVFENLEKITKEDLEKYQRHIIALKKILKKQEGSKTTEKVITKKRTQLE